MLSIPEQQASIINVKLAVHTYDNNIRCKLINKGVLYIHCHIVSLQGLLVLVQSEKSVHFVDGRIEHFLDSVNVSGYYGYCYP